MTPKTEDEGFTPAKIKLVVAEALLTRTLPDIHDRAAWRRWAKEQSDAPQRKASLAAKRNKVLWE